MEEYLIELYKKIDEFPTTSGCYKMINENKKILYIGKAKNLKSRIKSYFLKNASYKIRVLIRNVKKIEIITTNDEYEALLLECNLIKKYKPDFNIKMKDDKGYPMIRITNEKYPKIFKTRKIINDKSEYFGPYVNVKILDQLLDFINKNFKTRKCKVNSKVPCFYFHMGQCLGICFNNNLEENYKKEVEKVRKILNGDIEDIVNNLNLKIKSYVKKENYEQALKLRNTKEALIQITKTQIITKINKFSADYIYVHSKENLNTIIILKYRDGKLIEKDIDFDESIYEGDEIIHQFLIQYYTALNMIAPEKLYIFKQIDAKVKNIQKLINEIKNTNTEIIYEKNSETLRIMKMAISNAELALREYTNKKNKSLENLKILLEMKKLPKIIEGFDIAHLQGKETVASLVSFKMGKPNKEEYRIYKINSLKNGEIDDFKAIREVIARRYSKLINEKQTLPDLILIDGGKGQLNSAYLILQGLGIENKITICSLAKKEEIIFLINKKEGINLPEGHPALRILQNVRNEAHRKANELNKKRREKIKLIYTEIDRVGEQTAKKILKNLGTCKDIIKLTENEIAEKIKVNKNIAKKIKEFAIQKNLTEEKIM